MSDREKQGAVETPWESELEISVGSVPVFSVSQTRIWEIAERAAVRARYGWHLVQLCGSTIDKGVQVLYTFVRGRECESFLIEVPDGTALPTVTDSYPAAFIFENELQDLYGIRIEGLKPDFQGNLYKISVPVPMDPRVRENMSLALRPKDDSDEALANRQEDSQRLSSEAAPEPDSSRSIEAASDSLKQADAKHISPKHGKPKHGKLERGRALHGRREAAREHDRSESEESASEATPKRTVIPFGPQHPVLPEPIHLDLELEDEKVVRAIPQLGFVHRGLEKLVQVKDYQHFVYVAERVCGICSFGHSYGYSQALEQLMGVSIPVRADFLRVIWNELSRIHSHLLWLGLMADGFGFENLFYQCWHMREVILDIFERTTGGRVILSVCNVGGVNLDIENADLADIVYRITEMEKEYAKVSKAFLHDSTVANRLVGIGVLSREDAFKLGCVGPFGKASGVGMDVRNQRIGGYAALNEFIPITSNECDGYGRAKVRIEEVFQSVAIIRELVSKIPSGPVSVKVRGNLPKDEFAQARIEQPRGEAYYMVMGNGSRYLERFRVRTPTSQNLAGLLKILEGCELADVPVNILTIDPCISCTER